MASLDALSEQQRNAYNTFTEVTGLEDSTRAIAILSATNWNVESALALHFEGGLDSATQTNTPPETGPRPPTDPAAGSTPTSILEELERDAALNRDLAHEVAPRVSPTPTTYSPRPSLLQTLLLSPFSLGYKMLNSVLYFLSWMFPFLPRLTGYYALNRAATRTGADNSSIDPKNTAARFVRQFEETYGADSGLPFFEGGYTQALDRAKAELKYLVVVLQSDEHDETAPFVRNVLLAPQVVELLKRDDVVLWAGNVAESEAYLVASGLDVTKFPFACLVAPAPKTPTSTTVVMSVLARAQGALSADEFVATIEEKMEAHQPKLLALVLDRQERESSQRLRREQDAAYERSLAADRARAQAAREAEERAAAARRAEQEAVQAAERQAALRDAWRQWRAASLAPEPPTGEKAARIGVRLDDGTRLVRRFGPDATLEDVYAFVECNSFLNSSTTITPPAKPDNYTHKYDFSLVSPMPRRVIPVDSSLVSDDKALWPSGNLVVESNDDD